jgi:hypothetical protein
MLRLLAIVAVGLGAKSLTGYEPPSEQINELSAVTAEPEAALSGTEERRLQVLAFTEATGGG